MFAQFSMYLSLLCSQVLPKYLNFLSICINMSSILAHSPSQEYLLSFSKMLQAVLVVLSALLLHCQPIASLTHYLRNSIFLSPLLDFLCPEYIRSFLLLFMGSKIFRPFITENTFYPHTCLVLWLHMEIWMCNHFPLEL